MKLRFSPHLVLVLAFATCAWSRPAAAQSTQTWSTAPTSGNWSVSGNWTSGTAPVGNDSLAFGSTTVASSTNNLTAGTQINGITFNSGASVYTLTGNQIMLGGSVTNNSSNTQTLSLPLALSATQSFNAASGGLTLSSVISGAGGLTKLGSGTVTLSGASANTYTGTTTVSAGALILNKTAGVNAVAGNLVITDAGVALPTSNQIADTAAVTMSGTAATFNGPDPAVNPGVALNLGLNETIGSLTVTGGRFYSGGANSATGFAVTGAASFTGGAGNTSFVQNSGGLSSFGSLSLAGMTSTNINTDNSAVANRFWTNGNNARQSVIAVGSGGLSLDGSNILLAAGNAGSRLVLDGDVTTIGSATSAITGASATTTPVWLSGTAGSVTRTFTTGGGGANLSITAPITNGSATTAGITKAGPGTLTLSGTGANTYSGATTVSAGVLTLAKTAGVNAVAGNLTIENAAVRFTNSSQIADTAAVTMSGSNSFFNGSSYNNGAAGNPALDETLGSLTVSGGVFFPGGATATTGLAVTGAASFTGGAGNTQYLQNSGGLASFGSLSLVGMNSTAPIGPSATPNQFALAGSSTARQTTLTVGSGGLSLEGSNLNLSLGSAVGSLGSRIVLDGDVSTTGGSASSIFAGTGDGAQAGTRAVELSSTAGSHMRTFTVADVTSSAATDLNVGVPITNGVATSGGITKAGPGTLLLSAANTYTGATTISAGTLALGAAGSFASSPTITVGDAGSSGAVLNISAKTGTFAFTSGQTVGGIGTIKMDAGDTAQFAGILAPGNSPGIITIDGGTALLSGTTQIEIFGTGRGTGYDAIDLINSAVIDYGNGVLALDFGSWLAVEQSYQLFGNGSQSLTGDFSSVTIAGTNYTGLTFTGSSGVWTSQGTSPSGQTLTFTEATGTLVIVPEPGALALAGMGIAAAVWAARRRCS